MSDQDSDSGDPKGFDISKLDEDMTGEERAAASELMTKHIKDLTQGSAVMVDALRGVGGLITLQEALGSMNSLPNAINASGISGIHERVREAMSGLGTVMDHLRSDQSVVEETLKELSAFPEDYMDSLNGAAGSVALASGLNDRMRELGLGADISFSRIAAGIAEQQRVLDQMHRDRLEIAPPFRDIHRLENPLIETNRRLERIEHRFDQISSVAETSAQTATELQLAAAEFLKDFKEAATKNDKAAADAIGLGKQAMWAAVLIPILVFVAQIAANDYMPNRDAEALQQAVIGLQTNIDALQAADAEQTQRLIDAIAASDEATAAAILEGLREFQSLASDPPPIAD